MRPRAIALCTALALMLCALALALTPGPAGADVFGRIGIASEGFLPAQEAHPQQAVYAHDPAIAGNGRYVAFDGYFAGRTGVWRRDLLSGVIEPVAVGTGNEDGEFCTEGSSCDAVLPSISESGRYVSFTTSAKLSSQDTNAAPDVYVRDMQAPAGQMGEYTLASPLTYEYSGSNPEAEEAHYGSIAAGRSALSADGREVAFVTTAISNLNGSGTPPMQVGVHNLESGTTELVSSKYPGRGHPEAVFGLEGSTELGAVYSASSKPPQFPFGGRAYGMAPAVGASISADGTTVAWMGVDIAKQAALLSREASEVKPAYVEPLWRRIADGPLATTRRVTGGSDPASPACIASGETALPVKIASSSDPCQGPFAVLPESGVAPGTIVDAVPQLSADGEKVAFLTSAPLVSLGGDFELGQEPHPNGDAYLVNMQEGLTRAQALRPLTELASGKETELRTNATILDLAISPDGNQVAFATKRTEFPLGSPAYVSAPAGVAGLAELYDADLANDTLTRVSEGFEGGASEHPHTVAVSGAPEYNIATDGVLSPSFSQGDTLAFSSTASNLVFGDGNTPPVEAQPFDGSDAFYVNRVVFTPVPTETGVSGTPPNPLVVPSWRLGVTASSRANGSVELYAEVPAPGSLHAGARATVRVRASARERRRHAKSHLATRTVASVRSNPHGPGLVAIVLNLSSAYRGLAGRHGGISATVEVEFSAAGHPVLRRSIVVSFVRTTHPARKARRKPKARRG